MLQELYITNFALIDKVTIKLCEGLNVFSGATGVGKSLVIGALNFILGGRVTSDVVRGGKDEATVIGKFYIKDRNKWPSSPTSAAPCARRSARPGSASSVCSATR